MPGCTRPAPWTGVKLAPLIINEMQFAVAFGTNVAEFTGDSTSHRRMPKYSKKASDKVEKAMHERKRGTLKSGSGKKVTSRKQAIAIGLSEARKEGAKVPKKKPARKSSKK